MPDLATANHCYLLGSINGIKSTTSLLDEIEMPRLEVSLTFSCVLKLTTEIMSWNPDANSELINTQTILVLA